MGLPNKRTCQASTDIYSDKLWVRKKDRKIQMMLKKMNQKKKLRKKVSKLQLRKTSQVKDPTGNVKILNPWRRILKMKIIQEIPRQRAAAMMKKHKKMPKK